MQSFLLDLPMPIALARLPLARLPCVALVEEDHGSAELLKKPARPPRLEYFKYFAIRVTLRTMVPAPMDAEILSGGIRPCFATGISYIQSIPHIRGQMEGK